MTPFVFVSWLFGLLSGLGFTRQKLSLFLERTPFVRRLGIQLGHAFELLGCHLRQMPNEVDEMPRLLFPFLRASRPGRHPRQFDSVLDDVKQLAVAQLLCCALTHVRHAGVHPAADLSLSAAVVAVTG